MTTARAAKKKLEIDAEVRGQDARTPAHMDAKPGTLIAPVRLDLINGWLRFRLEFDDETQPAQAKAAPRDLLTRFMALADSTDEDVLRFAKRFAVLGVCQAHALPIGHGEPTFTMGDFLAGYKPQLLSDCKLGDAPFPDATRLVAWESAADWRLWARRFTLVFDYASRLKAGDTPKTPLNRPFLLGWAREPAEARFEMANPGYKNLPWLDVSRVINSWMLDARVTPRLVATSGHREMILSGSPKYAFPALALQLFQFIRGAELTYYCHGCNRDMPKRKRAPKTGQKAYCHRVECHRKRRAELMKRLRAAAMDRS